LIAYNQTQEKLSQDSLAISEENGKLQIEKKKDSFLLKMKNG